MSRYRDDDCEEDDEDFEPRKSRKTIPFNPKPGQKVFVSDDSIENVWEPRIFVVSANGVHWCIDDMGVSEQAFIKASGLVYLYPWKHIKEFRLTAISDEEVNDLVPGYYKATTVLGNTIYGVLTWSSDHTSLPVLKTDLGGSSVMRVLHKLELLYAKPLE